MVIKENKVEKRGWDCGGRKGCSFKWGGKRRPPEKMTFEYRPKGGEE